MSTVNEFDQIVKPSFKIKSAIWKHDGFPADDTGTITDQKKTICRLCRAVVTYSGNKIVVRFKVCDFCISTIFAKFSLCEMLPLSGTRLILNKILN